MKLTRASPDFHFSSQIEIGKTRQGPSRSRMKISIINLFFFFLLQNHLEDADRQQFTKLLMNLTFIITKVFPV